VNHPLLARLASRDDGERRRACRDAAMDPAGILLVAALEEVLDDRVPAVAAAAADALAGIGARSGGVDESLARALRSDRPNARWAAAFAGARLAPPRPRLLPPLVEALACDAGEIRWRAARLLVQCAEVLPEVEPLLLGLARSDAPPRVRRMALHCLRELSPHAAETAQALLAATEAPEVEVRRASLAALAALRDPPSAAGERLLAVFTGDSDTTSRCIAVSALASLATRNHGDVPGETQAILEQAAQASEVPALRIAARRGLLAFATAGESNTPTSRSGE